MTNSDEARIDWTDEREAPQDTEAECQLCKGRTLNRLTVYHSGIWAQCQTCGGLWRYAPPAKYTYGAHHDA